MINHVVTKHPKGLAVIYWSRDEHYMGVLGEEEMSEEYCYYLNLDVYDQNGVLVFEDALGGVFIDGRMDSKEFVENAIQEANYLWCEKEPIKFQLKELS